MVESKTVENRSLRPNYFSSNLFQHSVRTQQKIYFTTGKNGSKASLKLHLHFYMQIQTNVLSFYKSQNFLCRSNLFQQDQKLNRIYALSFYRSQNFLCWSKFFEPAQKFIYTLYQLQTFCARHKDDLHSVKLVFVPAQKFLKRH